ncbi:MAG: CDP-archaeol synthase [Candidatus Nanoarchaeia archaeon]
MEERLIGLLSNKIFLSVVIATILAQFLKLINKLVQSKKFEWSKLWETGGMPSCHAALASALAFSVFLKEGISTISIVTAFLCIVIIRDAFGIRQEVNKQGKSINSIIKKFSLKKEYNIEWVCENAGHNIFEVISGILVGGFITYAVFFIDFNVAIFSSLGLLILTTFYYALPGLIANMIPVFVRNRFRFLAIPVDLGKKFRGKRIFGSHKTVRGFVFGILGGLLIGLVQFLVSDVEFFSKISYIEYDVLTSLVVGFVFGFAALFADTIESFVKRQIGIRPGKPFIPFDQMDYVIGIAVFSVLFKPVTIKMLVVLILLGPLLSIITTRMGYLFRIRNEKW